MLSQAVRALFLVSERGVEALDIAERLETSSGCGRDRWPFVHTTRSDLRCLANGTNVGHTIPPPLSGPPMGTEQNRRLEMVAKVFRKVCCRLL